MKLLSFLNLTVASVILCLTTAGCSSGKFASTSVKHPKVSDVKKKPVSPQDSNGEPPITDDTGVQEEPNTGAGDISTSLVPDYAQCAGLPSAGYFHRSACPENQVMVIINDGDAGGMSCCPVGKNILSAVPAEVHQVRQGVCLADEVATGLRGNNVTTLCTKINPALKLLPAGSTTRIMANKAPGSLKAIAASYHNKDCCICSEGSILIGGHTMSDGSCRDQCVKIVRK